MLQGGIDLSSVNAKALLVNVSGGGTTYTYSASHEFLSDIPSGARIATSGNLSGKAIGNDGSFDSDDPTFSGMTGDSIESIVLYIDTGTAETSRLIMCQNTGITGLPLTTMAAMHRLWWMPVAGSFSDSARSPSLRV
jgi:hypothetical protein